MAQDPDYSKIKALKEEYAVWFSLSQRLDLDASISDRANLFAGILLSIDLFHLH